MSTGILIAVEGIDGAGKTTQVKMLGSALRRAGEDPVLSKEPTDGPWGLKIRESAKNGRMSLEDELAAFVEDRKEHVANVIEPSLRDGKIVILDRYFYSTIAYQGARGAAPEILSAQMKSFAPVPDAVLLFDLEPVVGLSRISKFRGDTPNSFERLDSLSHVRDVFKWIAETHDEIRVLDAHESVKRIHEQVIDILVEGVFRRFTAKNYECDCWYCSHREAGTCRWFTLQERLRSSRSREIVSA
jgi:dTMP kinase